MRPFGLDDQYKPRPIGREKFMKYKKLRDVLVARLEKEDDPAVQTALRSSIADLVLRKHDPNSD